MTRLTFHEIEQLSAWLDGQLPPRQAARLQTRLGSDPELAAVLAELRFSRAILRRTPQRRAPRNFTLSNKTAGIRPPLPRLVPAFSWASAVAALMFVITIGSGLFSGFGAMAAEPMMLAVPPGMGGGSAETYDAVGGGVEEPELKNSEENAPPAADDLTASQPAEPMEQSAAEGESREATAEEDGAETRPPLSPWLWIWSTLALLFITTALLIRWGSQWAFKRRNAKK